MEKIVVNRRHDKEKPYLGFIQQTKFSAKQELFIVRSSLFYNKRQREKGMFTTLIFTVFLKNTMETET